MLIKSILRTACAVSGLVIATSASAASLSFDQTPAVDAVKASLAVVGVPVPVRQCAPGGVVSGSLAFVGPVDLAQGLRKMGGDVVFTGTGFEVGCATQRPAPAASPAAASVPAGNPLAPSAGAAGGAAPAALFPNANASMSAQPGAATSVTPVAPPEVRIVQTKYLPGSRFTEMLKGLPGFSVYADADHVGPLMLVGAKRLMNEAVSLVGMLDRCPTSIEVQASILVKDANDDASRSSGIRVSSGNSFLGTDSGPTTGFRVNIPALQAFITAARTQSGLVQVSNIVSEVVQGEKLTLNDGEQVPIRDKTTVANGQTNQGVTYRSVGHSITITVLAADGPFLVGTITHELSSLGPNTDLGPTFATKGTTTTFRVRPYEPIALALSGLQTASQAHSKGILYGSRDKAERQTSGVLVLALRPVSCELALTGLSGGVGEATQPAAPDKPPT